MTTELSNNQQVIKVSTFDELIHTEFVGERNAVCWYRNLNGNFKEVVTKLQLKENVSDITAEELLALTLSKEGNLARAILLDDLKLLTDWGARPSLNLIKNYQRDEELDFISTDVYSYHLDRSPIAADTF